MANKYVTNPCKLSGKPVPPNSELAYWRDPTTNTTRVICPECSAFISINRKSGTYRSHNEHTDPQTIYVTSTFVCGNPIRMEESIQNLVQRDDELTYVRDFE